MDCLETDRVAQVDFVAELIGYNESRLIRLDRSIPNQLENGICPNRSEEFMAFLDESQNDKCDELTGVKTRGSIFLRLVEWFKSDKKPDADVESQARIVRHTPTQGSKGSTQISIEFPESIDEALNLTEPEMIEVKSIPTEEVSILNDEIYFDDTQKNDFDAPGFEARTADAGVEAKNTLRAEEVFNLERPSSIAAAAAEAQEYFDDGSFEQINFSTDMVYDEDVDSLSQASVDDPKASAQGLFSSIANCLADHGHVVDPGPESDGAEAVREPASSSEIEPDEASLDSTQRVRLHEESGGETIETNLEASDETKLTVFNPTQPTPTDTLYDPRLARWLTNAHPDLTSSEAFSDESVKHVPLNFDASIDSSDPSNATCLNASAADTIRDEGPPGPDPEFEKERFSILQSQIDELERENELLNTSLLLATKEVERIEPLADEMTRLNEQLDANGNKNRELEAQLKSLKRELETTQAQQQFPDKPVQLEELQAKIDSVLDENESLVCAPEQARFELAKQLRADTTGPNPADHVPLDGSSGETRRSIEASDQADLVIDSAANEQPVSDLDPKKQVAYQEPDFFRRFELRLKKEYKNCRQAERQLAQAEEQRNKLASALRENQHKLDDVRSKSTETDELIERIAQLEQLLDGFIHDQETDETEKNQA